MLQNKYILIFLVLGLSQFWPLRSHCMQIYGPSTRRNDSIKGNKSTSMPVRTIHLGYVDDDADDVIHIIEPPQHFQELKRRRQQILPGAAPKTAAIMKVKGLPQAASTHQAINRRRRRPPITRDLLTQETKAQSRTENLQLPLNVKFPMEILASVRQTERILQQRQQQPYAKQRIKSQQTHTVISEQGYGKSYFKLGKEQRFGGVQTRSKPAKRVRRGLNDMKNYTQFTTQQIALKATPKSVDSSVKQGTELLMRLSDLLKNATLYLPDDIDDEAVNVIATPQNSLLSELRTRFQQQAAPKKLIGEIEPTAKTYGINQQRQPSSSLAEGDIYKILENSLNATDALMKQIMRKHNNNSDAFKCNSQSLIEFGDSLQQFQSKIDCMRQQLEAVQRNSALPPLPTKIFIIPPSTVATTTKTTPTTRLRGYRRFGSRSPFNSANITPATTATTTQQSHNSAVALRQRQRFNKKSAEQLSNGNRIEQQHSSILKTKARKTATPTQLLAVRNVSAAAAALLYDDVMTNIRNMLEAKHLKLLVTKPDAASTKAFPIPYKASDDDRGEPFVNDDFIEVSSSSASPIGAVQAENNFRDLSFYLSGLQQMMSRFPHLTSKSTVPLELARNARTDDSTDAMVTGTDWYLINDEGKISETPYGVQLQPAGLIFHRFPDIPNAALYLQNHSSRSESFKTRNESNFEFF